MEDERSGLPFLAYVLIGLLALVGLFTIGGWLFSTVMLLVRLVIIAVVVLLIIGVLRAIFGGGRRRSEV